MSKLVILFLTILAHSAAFSQQATEYLDVSALTDQSAYKPGDTVRLALQASIKKPYHINSFSVNDPTLIPTVAEAKGRELELIGVLYPEHKKLKFEFSESEINVYEDKEDFIILARISSSAPEGPFIVSYSLDFQACDDKVCYQPKTFRDSIELIVSNAKDVVVSNAEVFRNPDFQGKANFVSAAVTTDNKLTENERTSNPAESEDQVSDWITEKGLFTTLLLIFLGGLALNLTPCVYPLIPITLSYFGAQSSGSKSQSIMMGVFYALGMAVTYSALGLIAATTGGILGTALQNPIVIIFIALIMAALGLSMFGLFEISVPQKLALIGNTNRSGYFGSLLMGLTVGFIAAPCIGPFVLSLLVYVGKLGSPVMGFLLFFVLAMGLGLPYIFLAASSSSISKLPRSGEWMIGVKVIFGLILFGMALFTLAPLFPKDLFDKVFPVYIILSGIYLILFDRKGKNSEVYNSIKNIIAIAAVAAGAWMLKPDAGHEEVKWNLLASLESVESSIKSEGKPVVIDFYADWCAQCKELDKYTYTDAEVVEKTRDFNKIKVDLTKENEAITSKFGIKGLPVVVFMGPDGKEFKELRITGFVEPEEFNKRVESLQKIISEK